MGAEIELIFVVRGKVVIGSDDDKIGLRVSAVEDACDGGGYVDSVAVAELVVMAVEDVCDGGRLVDSVTQAELVVMECVTVKIEERVLEHTEMVADKIAVPVTEFRC